MEEGEEGGEEGGAVGWRGWGEVRRYGGGWFVWWGDGEEEQKKDESLIVRVSCGFPRGARVSRNRGEPT